MKNIKKIAFLVFALVFVLTSCKQKLDESFKKVTASVQTQSVNTEGDAADDPAIWYNEQNPSESRIIGTDKKKGLGVYNLSGELLSFTAVGMINNCDLQYDFPLGKDTIVVIGGSNRTNNATSIYKFNTANSSVDSMPLIHIPSHSEEIYGFCFYKNRETNELFSFSIGKDGLLEQYKISADSNGIYADSVWTYKFDTQCEGLVADNENGILFVGEENFGVWKLDLNSSKPEKQLVTSLASNPKLKADIEGLSMYFTANGGGYLLVSSQGNNSYALFDRKAPHKYLGSFAVVDGENIDGTSETDGIDVTNLAMGDAFPNGFFIAQDGENYTDGVTGTQNFKLVPWENIANSFDPALKIDNNYTGF